MAEKKFGISSTFAIQCSICSQTNHISTSKQHRAGSRGPKAFDANTRVALAALDNGIGFSHVNSILTALDIPNMTRKTYKVREREVGKIAEGVAKATCKVMFDKECELVKENGGTVDTDGLLPLSVSYDMGWSKRGRAHNSLTGHGAVMGSLTGKALDFTTRNKFCRTCQSASQTGGNPKPHDCRVNHQTSSKSMEPLGAVELFKRAPVQNNNPAKYAVFIGDDDCSTLSKIREEVVYHVEKWSDTVHAKRTLINHLHKLKCETSFPRGESALSNKVIDYLGKCFSYSVAQNAGNTDGMQKAIRLIVPHAFGNHEHCLESWCGYKQDPTSYKHRDLPFGKDLVGESLKRSLEEVFEIYSSENVIKKLAHNASSQRNESLNSTIGSKNPKIRFYGGSESADQRVACSVAQKNMGKQYLLNVLQSANINPGCTMTSQVSKMDYERKQDQLRKQSKDFKKKRKQLRNVRSSKDSRLESRDGTVYESGSTLSLDPEVIIAASIQKAEIYQFEQQVPQFCFRKPRRYQTFNPGFEYNFVIYDTETNCGGKKAELVELSAFCHGTGDSFTKFVLPQHDINIYVSNINKFRIASFGNERVLHRNGFALQTVSLPECLLSFANFLKSTSATIKNATSKPVKILLIGHNANAFDTPLLIRSIAKYTETEPKFKELDLLFADSLVLIRHLLKENNQLLRKTDGSIPKVNLRDIYKCLFQSEFDNSHQGLADVMALDKVLFQSKLELTTEQIVNNSNTMILSTVQEDVQYLDKAHERLLTFNNRLYDDSDNSIIKKSLAKKLADSGLSFSDLRKLYSSTGPRGVAALLANPPSTSKGKSPRGTKCCITLQKIINFLKTLT